MALFVFIVIEYNTSIIFAVHIILCCFTFFTDFELSHMDEFIDSLLREDRVCDCILPRIQKRLVLEENNELDPRISALDDDMDDIESSDEEGELRVGWRVLVLA